MPPNQTPLVQERSSCHVKVRQTPSTAWVYQTYRRRFGIETSYRQLNEARIKTTTRDPALRLLFVAIALILRNVWVWVHRQLLAPHAGVDAN